ncbi:amidohydrolase family protein [Novosphingobium resinovorum]|uniref:Amidohydrolase-related domain-containing protein n=1 Tax=Novosphingobium resinovorum TaxID=158500 RepID=A0A1D8A6N7_9SPHN|nr:amidohydrolase family protein [Novosphingobium resinovorum]AOR77766.1 hypothetical protein BES08_14140 [Novosphingobium resinovorum]
MRIGRPPPPPRLGATRAPIGSCDCHVHVLGPQSAFPLAADRSYDSVDLAASDVIHHLNTLGLERAVVVTPTAYGADNSATLSAIQQFSCRLRGIAVLDGSESDTTLSTLSSAGFKGARLNLLRSGAGLKYVGGATLADAERLAPRLRKLGWHLQLFIHFRDLLADLDRYLALGVTLVVDHLGRALPDDLATEDFGRFLDLLATNSVWCKLSGADRLSSDGAPFTDIDAVARRIADAAPTKVVWGSDWPHVAYFDRDPPHAADLLDALFRWADPAALRQILCENPARLYEF